MSFEIEKKAVEYCAQYGIDENDPRRAEVITAFCTGAKIELAAYAKGRAEGLREALEEVRTWRTIDQIDAAIERLLDKPPMNPARAWPLEKLR